VTLKEQLLQELEHTPDPVLEQVFNFLRFLNTNNSTPLPPHNSLTSLIGQAQGIYKIPEEADQFIRQERDSWDS
jgi:hypothetical protein